MPWGAIYVSSRCEKKVADFLIYKKIEVYLPLVKTMRQWSDRKKMIEMPLIRGYLFINFNEQDKDTIVNASGVVNFVYCESKIAIIKTEEIERLKQLVTLGYEIQVTSINKKYVEGDKIKIMSGALKGIEGFVMDESENKIIEVLIEGINQCIRVKIPKDSVIELEKTQK